MTNNKNKNLVNLTSQYCCKGLGSTFWDNSISLELDSLRLIPEKMKKLSHKRYDNSYLKNKADSFQRYIYRKG